jgi:hypothetical protein
MRLLYLPRAIFWIEVPLDTKWYEVAYLTESELDELTCLRAITRNGTGPGISSIRYPQSLRSL